MEEFQGIPNSVSFLLAYPKFPNTKGTPIILVNANLEHKVQSLNL